MSLTPADMDFIQGKNAAAREIALAFGVPAQLLGIPGDNSYANYQEASWALWRQTVIAAGYSRVAAQLGRWLSAQFGEDLHLDFDRDGIEALAGDREALWRRLIAADFLTADEKRAAAGYEALGQGETVSLKRAFDPNQPRAPAGNSDGGQWTDGGGDASGAYGDGRIRVAQSDSNEAFRNAFDVDLHEEEAAGGYAIRDHVGRSSASLLASVRGDVRYLGLFVQRIRRRDGSFPSIVAASKLVNSTLARRSPGSQAVR